jgi:hypothetical protein
VQIDPANIAAPYPLLEADGTDYRPGWIDVNFRDEG